MEGMSKKAIDRYLQMHYLNKKIIDLKGQPPLCLFWVFLSVCRATCAKEIAFWRRPREALPQYVFLRCESGRATIAGSALGVSIGVQHPTGKLAPARCTVAAGDLWWGELFGGDTISLSEGATVLLAFTTRISKQQLPAATNRESISIQQQQLVTPPSSQGSAKAAPGKRGRKGVLGAQQRIVAGPAPVAPCDPSTDVGDGVAFAAAAADCAADVPRSALLAICDRQPGDAGADSVLSAMVSVDTGTSSLAISAEVPAHAGTASLALSAAVPAAAGTSPFALSALVPAAAGTSSLALSVAVPAHAGTSSVALSAAVPAHAGTASLALSAAVPADAGTASSPLPEGSSTVSVVPSVLGFPADGDEAADANITSGVPGRCFAVVASEGGSLFAEPKAPVQGGSMMRSRLLLALTC